MALPSNIEEEIRKKAESYNKYGTAISPYGAYIAGATEYATKAQGLADALEKAKKYIDWINSCNDITVGLNALVPYADNTIEVKNAVNAALSSWKEGKEGKV